MSFGIFFLHKGIEFQNVLKPANTVTLADRRMVLKQPAVASLSTSISLDRFDLYVQDKFIPLQDYKKIISGQINLALQAKLLVGELTPNP